jgi:hypothetical protein
MLDVFSFCYIQKIPKEEANQKQKQNALTLTDSIDRNATKTNDQCTHHRMTKFVELSMPDDKPKDGGFVSSIKNRWSRLKERLVYKGYTGRKIDNGAKFWVTALFVIWIGLYTALVSTRT